eukprot:12913687-Prorocentrum_lima.AAC.1
MSGTWMLHIVEHSLLDHAEAATRPMNSSLLIHCSLAIQCIASTQVVWHPDGDVRPPWTIIPWFHIDEPSCP